VQVDFEDILCKKAGEIGTELPLHCLLFATNKFKVISNIYNFDCHCFYEKNGVKKRVAAGHPDIWPV
jgi:hypothetical protein